MRKVTAGLTALGVTLLIACDDGRQQRIPGVEPGREALPADTAWPDTLHPPVPGPPDVPGPDPAPTEPVPPADGTTPPAGQPQSSR